MSHPILERLRHPDPAVRRDACRDAVEDPSAVLLVDALGAALADPVGSVHRAAAEALEKLAPAHPSVAELLRRALHAEDPRLRFGAALARARLAPPEPALLPAIVEALSRPDPDVRWTAARLLVDLGRLHREALPVAAALARTDPDPLVRRMAIFCLRELAPEEPETAEVLLAASRDDDVRVRRAALASMTGLRDPGPAVERCLSRAAEADPDPAARRLAASARSLLGAADQKNSVSRE